ncbi:endonuclease [Sphingomonas oleivorans]|uniref:Endonuclease n=1 Tax=Sphingomonas oleivorans TaxID=1735121 RepID=A0A2T5FUT2_9SPHN|nr:RidA family protein [Sphingomonas oleivorans]PTQ08266.1 endonuclease [Sphingomonas oleivorans]
MKCSHIMALLATALTAAAGHAADVERRQSSPTAVIASSASLPAGSKIYFLSGSTASPINPADTESADAFGDTKTQTLSILTKMKAQLASLGLAMGDVVKLTVFLVGDPKLGGKMDRDGMTAAYKMFFGTPDQPNLPTRSTIQVAALGRPQTLVEIEAIAAKAP